MPDDAASKPHGGLPGALEDALFAAHFELHGDARDAALQQLCVEHPLHEAALRQALRRLRQTDTLLGMVRTDAVPAAAQPAPPPPRAFGPFALQRLLGRGGFGEVWLADQHEPIRRRVALKLLAPELLDDKAMARFELERHALGLLQHDNVARVLDAGTGPGGRSFFVMEYVEGLPLLAHCDHHRLAVRQRLQLFLCVCAGVHHAHQKGVLHRDLKPSNILVQMQDGRAVPKIIDFGVAKALHGELCERASLTEHGRLLGTPEYMSPEQAAGATVDTRADVYSLGVLLYELLTGELPFASTELRQAGMLAAARILAERPPQRPSERLRREPVGAAAAAALRDTTVPELLAVLGSDLDWVVLRSMAKDPDERYPSVTTLAAELQRFLDHQPLSARPPSRSYLLRKFVRRHRGGVATAASALVLILLAFAGVLWGLIVVDDARAVAVGERQRAEDLAYAAEIATAGLALRGGDAVGARLQLARTPTQLRGFEWRYLAARCGEAQAVFETYRALDLVTLADGKRVVGCGFDGTVRLHEVDTGAELRQLRPAGGERRSISLHPDGKRLAAVSPNGSLEVFDLESGATLLDVDLRDPQSQEPLRLLEVKFTPDGQTMACSGEEGLLLLLSLQGTVLRTVVTGQRWVRAIDFDPSGETCLTAGEDGLVCLWRTSDWSLRRRLQAHAATAVFSAAFSPDGSTFASCSADGTAKLWSTRDPGHRPLWAHDTGAKLLRLCFSPDGSRLAIAGGYRDSYLEVLDVATGRGSGPLLGHEEGVEALAFLPSGDRLLSSGYDGTLRLWNMRANRWYRRVAHDVALEDVAPAGDGSAVAVVSQGGRVSVFDAADLARRWTQQTGNHAQAVAFDSRRDRVLVLHPEGISTWVASTGASDRPMRRLRGGGFIDMALAADGADLLLVSQQRQLLVLDADSLDLRRAMPLPGPGHATAVGSDTIAATTSDGWLLCCGRSELRERWRLRVGNADGVYDVALAPDQRRIAVTLPGGHVAVLDAATGRELCRFDGHRKMATVTFSPDGSRLVTAGPDRRVKICDPERGLELLTLADAPFPAGRPVFSADGTSLYCTSSVQSGDCYMIEWRAPAQASLR